MPRLVDRTGQRFGHLVAISRSPNHGKRVIWSCRCDCGRVVDVESHALKSGNTRSCGCFARGVLDETGKRYGRLLVIGMAPVESTRRDGEAYHGAKWRCRCDCGKEIVTRGASLRAGVSQSCGCVGATKLGDRARKPKGVAARNQAVRAIKRAASERKLEWSLSDDMVHSLMGQPCFYCGQPPSNLSRHPEQNGECFYSGIDRLDNAVGYTPENVVPCCWVCNRAKQSQSVAEFLQWVDRVHSHSCNK